MTESSATQEKQYFLENDTEIRFLDPVLGSELKADEPPPSLFQDTIIARGFAQIQKMSAERRLTVQLLNSLHGAAEDFQDMLRDSGDALPQAKIVAVEMDWKSTFDVSGVTPLSAIEYILATYPGRLIFQNTQISWLTEHKKIILPCEYPDNYDGPLLRGLNSLLALCYQAKDAENSKKYTILWGAYQTTRQWLFIGQLGYWLHQLEIEEKLPLDHVKVPFMLGIHRAVATKLNSYFHIPTETFTVTKPTAHHEDFSSYLALFEKMTTNARVTQQELETPFSLE